MGVSSEETKINVAVPFICHIFQYKDTRHDYIVNDYHIDCRPPSDGTAATTTEATALGRDVPAW
ncbi:hypothetical protein C487_08884 [Natrinema pallidum DSM 3751]|uniref:Uncharacterized protein n=1 Tax=Natrinema pallidum DSM 3751 TaxID=1227495 RepID=L9YW61_9EURY|nr:hypothetical protein C487_08884 [Natrinema pallidum DSM 3751]